MKKLFLWSGIFFTGGFLLCAGNPTLDFTAGKNIWTVVRGLDITPQQNFSRCQITAEDSNIYFHNLAIDPQVYTKIKITYSAQGFKDKTSGEIFFGSDSGPTASVPGKNYFVLPSLIADGKIHQLEVNAKFDIPGGSELWSKSPQITTLRLDMVNEFPGTVDLYKVEFLKDDNIGRTVWDFAGDDETADWHVNRALTMKSTSDGLLLTVKGADSGIENNRLQIDPKHIGLIRITYQASGFNGKPTSGEVFFAGKPDNNYNGNKYFQVPSLTADGKVHTVTLDASKHIANGEGCWTEMQEINSLRLDIVNEFPGEIIIRKIEMLPALPKVINSVGELNVKQGYYYQNHDGKFALTLPAGEYVIHLHGSADHEVNNTLRNIKGFSPANTVCDPAREWNKAGTLKLDQVQKIAFTLPMDTVGLLIQPAATAVEPVRQKSGIPNSVPVKLGAKASAARHIVFDENMPYWKSQMIAGKDLWNFEGEMVMRREFNLKTSPAKVFIQTTADDEVREIYINGKAIPGKWTKDWKYPADREVTNFVRGGKNLIAIKHFNMVGLGGLMYELTVVYPDGSVEYIAGDGSERCAKSEHNPRFYEISYDDSEWQRADVRPGPPYAPWTQNILAYKDFRPVRGTYFAQAQVPAQLQDGETLTLKLTLKGTPDFSDEEIVYAHLYRSARTRDSRPVSIVSGKLKDFKFKRNADKSISLVITGFAFPEYGGEFSGTIDFGIYNRQLPENKSVSFKLAPRIYPGSGKKLIVENDGTPGKPTIKVNGKPFYPVLLDIFYERFPNGLTGADSPVNVRTFLAGGMGIEWWIGPDKYDFSGVDERISQLLREHPNAYIGAWVWCQPGLWYYDLYPERFCLQSDGKLFPYYAAPVTFSNAEYRKDAVKAIRAFIEHCEKYFGNKMFCYNLSGGVSLEWQGWGSHGQYKTGQLNDYSKGGERDFVNWAKKRYPQLNITRMPTVAERTSNTGGIFRDPIKEAAAIAYDEFYSEAIADCILEIASAAKKACGGNRLIGAYYGYYFEYSGIMSCQTGGGHNAANKLLRSPDIDFLLSPPSYAVRVPGEPGAEMKVFGSIANAGKFSILEDDTRTHLTPPADVYQTLNAEQTSNLLRRNWGRQLAYRMPLCMLTIGDGREFSSPEVRADLHKVQQTGQKIFEQNRSTGVEIAVVVDEDSLKNLYPFIPLDEDSGLYLDYYDADGKKISIQRVPERITAELACFQRLPLSRIGAGVDYIYVDDVPKFADKYKFWIFAGNFAASEKLEKAVNILKQRPVTVLLAYGAGFTGKTQAVDVNEMSRIWGMQFAMADAGSLKIRVNRLDNPLTAGLKQFEYGGLAKIAPRFQVSDPAAEILGNYLDGGAAALAYKKIGNMHFYYSGGVRLTDSLLRILAEKSGIFVYCDSGDNYFAGCNIHTIHAVRAGKKTIKFPAKGKISNLFTGEIMAENADNITLDLKAHETVVMEFEP